MTKLLSTGIDYDALKRLLRPLIATNRIAFSAQGEKELRGARLDERDYRSSWIFDQKLFHKLHPVTLSKRDGVVSEVVRRMRERCEMVDPGSSLLLVRRSPSKKQRSDEWNLTGEEGLASKVRACFEGPECRAEEYEDRIERVLYSYKVANMSAVKGAKGAS